MTSAVLCFRGQLICCANVSVPRASATGRQIQVQTPNGIQFLQLPVQQSMQTISVQIPMSTASGQTVYQTVQLPVAAAGGAQQLQLMPQIQVSRGLRALMFRDRTLVSGLLLTSNCGQGFAGPLMD